MNELRINLLNYSKPIKGKYYLNWETWRNFLKSSEYKKIESSTNLSINFTMDGFTLINLDGLIWLLLIGDKLHSQERRLFLTLPNDQGQLRYIKGFDFWKLAKDSFLITNLSSLDSIELRSYTYSMIEKVNNDTLNGRFLDEILISIKGLLDESLTKAGQGGISNLGQIGLKERDEVYYSALRELSKNVVEHSSRETKKGWGYSGIAHSGDKINLCIVDNGIGFLSSLKNKEIIVSNDEMAIEEAFLYGYKNREKLKGKGIFDVLTLIRKIGGSIMIRSGTGEGNLKIEKGTINPEEIKSLIENMEPYPLPTNFPGVQYRILLNPPLEK